MKTKRYGKSAWKHAKNAHQVPLIAIDYFQLFDKNSNKKKTISSVEKFLKVQDAIFCYLHHVLIRGSFNKYGDQQNVHACPLEEGRG